MKLCPAMLLVALVVIVDVSGCPFRVEISSENGKTMVNVINSDERHPPTDDSTNTENTDTENTDTEPINNNNDNNEHKHQHLGIVLTDEQKKKLAEMIERDSRDYLTEDTLNVIMKSVEAVSRMGSLTLGRATSDSAKDNHIDHTLKKPTLIEPPVTVAPSYTTTRTYHTTIGHVKTTTTTVAPEVFPGRNWPPETTKAPAEDQTKIVAWWNKMWYGNNNINV